jgi:hypothetical protein
VSGRVSWQPKVAGETVIRYADFTDELAAGEVVDSGSCELTVWSGNDPAPPTPVLTVIENTAGINAVLEVQVAGGVTGTIYSVLCIANTSMGRPVYKGAYLAIVPLTP